MCGDGVATDRGCCATNRTSSSWDSNWNVSERLPGEFSACSSLLSTLELTWRPRARLGAHQIFLTDEEGSPLTALEYQERRSAS
jgi:hypothetical protein